MCLLSTGKRLKTVVGPLLTEPDDEILPCQSDDEILPYQVFKTNQSSATDSKLDGWRRVNILSTLSGSRRACD